MIIPTDEEKAFDKIQYLIVTSLIKSGTEENLLNLIKEKEQKPIANVVFIYQKTECFPRKTGNDNSIVYPILYWRFYNR